MKKILIVLSFVFVLIGCSVSRKVTDKTESVSVISEIIRDTVLYIEGDSSVMRAYFECDSNYNVIMRQMQLLQGRKIKQDVQFRDRIFTVKAKIDSASIYKYWKEKYELKQEKQIVKVEVEKIKKVYPRWLVVLAMVGLLSLVYIGYRLYRKLTTIFIRSPV